MAEIPLPPGVDPQMFPQQSDFLRALRNVALIAGTGLAVSGHPLGRLAGGLALGGAGVLGQQQREQQENLRQLFQATALQQANPQVPPDQMAPVITPMIQAASQGALSPGVLKMGQETLQTIPLLAEFKAMGLEPPIGERNPANLQKMLMTAKRIHGLDPSMAQLFPTGSIATGPEVFDIQQEQQLERQKAEQRGANAEMVQAYFDSVLLTPESRKLLIPAVNAARSGAMGITDAINMIDQARQANEANFTLFRGLGSGTRDALSGIANRLGVEPTNDWIAQNPGIVEKATLAADRRRQQAEAAIAQARADAMVNTPLTPQTAKTYIDTVSLLHPKVGQRPLNLPATTIQMNEKGINTMMQQGTARKLLNQLEFLLLGEREGVPVQDTEGLVVEKGGAWKGIIPKELKQGDPAAEAIAARGKRTVNTILSEAEQNTPQGRAAAVYRTRITPATTALARGGGETHVTDLDNQNWSKTMPGLGEISLDPRKWQADRKTAEMMFKLQYQTLDDLKNRALQFNTPPPSPVIAPPISTINLEDYESVTPGAR